MVNKKIILNIFFDFIQSKFQQTIFKKEIMLFGLI
jgi:hypothetical protein